MLSVQTVIVTSENAQSLPLDGDTPLFNSRHSLRFCQPLRAAVVGRRPLPTRLSAASGLPAHLCSGTVRRCSFLSPLRY